VQVQVQHFTATMVEIVHHAATNLSTCNFNLPNLPNFTEGTVWPGLFDMLTLPCNIAVMQWAMPYMALKNLGFLGF